MGCWGSRVFQNDTALDTLGNVIDYLRKVINRDLRSAGTKSGSATLERPVAAAVAILAALATEIPSARRCFTKGEVRQWEQAYFQWFDRNLVPSAPVAFVKGCRKNEARQFNILLRYAYEG